MTNCIVCGKTHNNKLYCSKKCMGKALEKQIERTCAICGHAFTVAASGTKDGRGQYCSRACWAQSRKGVSMTPQNRVYLNCETCGKQFWKWPSAIVNRSEGRFCSYECLNEWKRTIKGTNHPLYKPPAVLVCEHCGETYETKPSLAKRSRFCSRQCQGAWTVQNQHRKRTRIEIAVEDWLRKHGVNYESQKGMGRFVCDFVVEATSLVIECDGTYWHALPLVKRKDKRKDKWLKSHGYYVLRLREDDIHNRPEWCWEQIAKRLQLKLL